MKKYLTTENFTDIEPVITFQPSVGQVVNAIQKLADGYLGLVEICIEDKFLFIQATTNGRFHIHFSDGLQLAGHLVDPSQDAAERTEIIEVKLGKRMKEPIHIRNTVEIEDVIKVSCTYLNTGYLPNDGYIWKGHLSGILKDS